MKFEIKNRWSGEVQFTAEIEASEDTPFSIKLGMAVKAAVKARANLKGANLKAAYGSNLYVRSVSTGTYDVAYTAEIMQIGCQRHAIADWWSFDDERIAAMDGRKALTFWRTWKPILQAMIAAAPATPTGYVAPAAEQSEPASC